MSNNAEHLVEYRFESGKSGNPKGRPRVSAKIRDLRENFGSFALEELCRMAVAASLPPDHEEFRPLAAKDKIKLLSYLDERFHGKAPTKPFGADLTDDEDEDENGDAMVTRIVIVPTEAEAEPDLSYDPQEQRRRKAEDAEIVDDEEEGAAGGGA